MPDQQDIINQLIDAIERITGNRDDWRSLVQAAVAQIERRRRRDQLQTRISQPSTEPDLLDWSAYRAKYGLHQKERIAAWAILERKARPDGMEYFVNQPPTEQQRKQIAGQTTLSTAEAASYLGISKSRFGKLRKQYSIEPIGFYSNQNAQTESGYKVAAHLFRKSDLDRLMKLLEK